jgi:hypothetical protein
VQELERHALGEGDAEAALLAALERAPKQRFSPRWSALKRL